MRCAVAAAVGAFAVAPTAALAQEAPASGGDPITILHASFADHDVESASRSDPLPLAPIPDVPFQMEVRNETDETLEIRFVRVQLKTLGLNWAHYDLWVHDRIAPRATKTINWRWDFFDIDDSVRGYVDAELGVFAPEQERLASTPFALDVENGGWSSIVFFVLLMLALAIGGVIEILVGTARRSLPRNRFLRALLFAFTGAAAALAIIIGAAILRVVLMAPTAWVPILVIFTVGSFVLGFLAPGRLSRDDATREEEVLDLSVEEAVARASGQFPAGAAAAAGAGAAMSHQSGEHIVLPHESGGYTPVAHESGGYTPAAHESGEHSAVVTGADTTPAPDAGSGPSE